MARLLPQVKLNPLNEAQLEAARKAGYTHVALHTTPEMLENPEAFVQKACERLASYGLEPMTLDAPGSRFNPSTRAEFIGSLKNAVQAAHLMGLRGVTINYPKSFSRYLMHDSGRSVKPEDLKDAALREELKSLLEKSDYAGVQLFRKKLIDSPWEKKFRKPEEFAVEYKMRGSKEPLALAKEVTSYAHSIGFKGDVQFEFVGTTGLAEKQQTLNDYRRLARNVRKMGGRVIVDWEHAMQHVIHTSLEQVHNPLKLAFLRTFQTKVRSVSLDRRSRGLIRKFYDNFQEQMRPEERKLFKQVFSQEEVPAGAADRLLRLVTPRKVKLPNETKHGFAEIIPSKFAQRVGLKAFLELGKEASEVHFVSGHAGLLADPLATRYGYTSAHVPIESGEHGFVWVNDKGETVVFGAPPGHVTYEYLHLPLKEGSFYPLGVKNMLYMIGKESPHAEVRVTHEFSLTERTPEGERSTPRREQAHRQFRTIVKQANWTLQRRRYFPA